MLVGCQNEEDSFIVNLNLSIVGNEDSLIIEISSLEPPKHVDFESGTQYFLYQNNPLELKLEENLNYKMKIYNTTKNLSTDIEQGQQLLNYIDKPLVEKQISVDADDKDVVIKL